MIEFLKQIKPLRIMLALLALSILVLRPEPGALPNYAGFELVTTLLAPTLAPIVLMLLFLDALMSQVLSRAQEGVEKLRHGRIVKFDLILALALLVYWLPYFYALG